MKLKITKRAQRRVKLVGAWWREHRPAAQNAFADELEWAKREMLSRPNLATRYHNSKGQTAAQTGFFLEVSAGTSHTCALRSDETAVCWGDNTNGRATAQTGRFRARQCGRKPQLCSARQRFGDVLG